MELLLAEIKRRLRVTWEDENEDNNLITIISSGKQYIEEIAGTPIDFDEDKVARELLYSYVLYGRADSVAEYGRNYNKDLLRLHLKYKAKRVVGNE